MNGVHIAKPPLTKINKTIIIATVALFLLFSITSMISPGSNFGGIFSLNINSFSEGFIFQLVTYPFIQHSLMNVLFNCLLLWFIGGELEEKWGSSLYLKFLSVSVIGAGIVYLTSAFLIGGSQSYIPLMGLDGVNLSLLVAYGVIYSERMMSFMLIFPMKAKYFCLLLAGIQIYMGIFSANRFSAWAHITAMLWGYLFLRWKSWSLTKLLKKKKSHLKLVNEDEEQKDPKYWQ